MLCKASEWAMALMHFGAVAVPNLVTFNAVLEACRLGSCWSLALELLGRLEDWQLEADVVPRISFGCGSRPRSPGAPWWARAKVLGSGLGPRRAAVEGSLEANGLVLALCVANALGDPRTPGAS